MTEREKEYVCMCVYTPYNDYVVGAMVTHQSGSGMRAAALHLLSQTPFSPFFSSSLSCGPLQTIERKKERKKDIFFFFLSAH